MKKTRFALVIFFSSLLLSAYKGQNPIPLDYYLVYNGYGTEKDKTSYATPTIFDPGRMNGTGYLNWLKVRDTDDSGTISITEFETYFELADQRNTGSNLLSDELFDNPYCDVYMQP